MPLVIHPRVRKAVRRIAMLTGLALLTGAGTALADCGPQTTSTPFAQWGDNNSYFLIPGGSFEGTPDQVGWTLSGASLTPGNEPFDVNSAGDSQSLTIDAGGTATSPFFCVDASMPDMRFFAQQVAGGSSLQVNAVVQTGGGQVTIPIASLADGSLASWAPTSAIGGAGGLAGSQSVQVALQFTVPGSAGSWQVDDVYVDPFRAG